MYCRYSRSIRIDCDEEEDELDVNYMLIRAICRFMSYRLFSPKQSSSCASYSSFLCLVVYIFDRLN